MSIMRVIEKASQFEKTQAVIYQSPFMKLIYQESSKVQIIMVFCKLYELQQLEDPL